MKALKFVFINLGILIFILISLQLFAFSWQKQTDIFIDDEIISLAIDSNKSSIIYAASQNSVYKTVDKGKSWQKIYHIIKANKKINKIYMDPIIANAAYILTQDGLYQSKNQGKDWQRIFIGSSDLENDCLSIAKSRNVIYLGTKQGLFISQDSKQWHKISGQFLDSIITSIIVDLQDQNVVYIACEKGVFISENDINNWKRIYVVYRSEIPSEDYNDYDGDVTDQILNINSMVISTEPILKLYIATIRGLFFTDNKGKRWQKITNLGLPTVNISSIAIHIDNEIFIATDKGIFRLFGNRWEKINNSFIYDDFNDLSFDRNGVLWLAGKGGVFNIDINELNEFKDNDENSSKNLNLDITRLFIDEPTIGEVQKAAIEYAEVNINKIKTWRRQASLKALFPTISVGYDKSVYGSSSGAMAVGPRDWDIDLSWDVGELIWNSDQTSIDTRSRLTVQLRQDVLDQITHLYFERRRLLAQLFLSPPKTEEEKLYRNLEIEEITANIDGLTNGFFTKFFQQSK